ncbi:MAG TPA: nuclear transport factor 2 family protein [Sporichthyaceae bacterium]|jgi:ketosteroid isomerase-like protein|nr:nuclear transport factor 2 family protein [Sporichthyaceae bacterium]
MTPQADRDTLLELTEDLYAAFENADLDRMGALWADGGLADSVICVHPGWPSLRGREEVMRSWAMIMANTSYIQFVLTDVEVALAGEVAVVTCVENIITAADEESNSDPTAFAGAKGVATNVFRRTGTGWRLWVRHGSPVLSGVGEVDEVGGVGQDG